MEPIAPAAPTPTKQQLIAQLSKPIAKVMSNEMADEADVDRVWLLRKFHKNYLYMRDLQNFAPALYQGLVDASGVGGEIIPDAAWQGGGAYDWSQNIVKGYASKLMAVLGTRIPNAIAVPNDPTDEADIKASRAANNAAMYIRQHSEMQILILWMIFSLYLFGTSFWSIEWVVDGDRFGWKMVDEPGPDEDMTIGGGWDCPICGKEMADASSEPPSQCPQCGSDAPPSFRAPEKMTIPGPPVPKKVAKGSLDIDITDGSEVSVPLDTDGRKGVEACQWIRREREQHKSQLLARWPSPDPGTEAADPSSPEYKPGLREMLKDRQADAFEDQSASLQYGESIRSAMASPIGVVRPKRENRWTIIEEDWAPRMYEMVDDSAARKLLKKNFPNGIRITAVKGIVVDLEDRSIIAHWQECQPTPTKRIMADPLGDDWITTQDILNNILNQCSETIERSNNPGFADPTRVDIDAWQRRRAEPGDLIPAVRPAGGTLNDIIAWQPQLQFSEQIPPFRAQVEQTSQQITGLLEIIWGGDTTDPTARQSELKTNAAIRQLSVIWVLVGNSLEKVYEKGCALLAEHEEGVLSFTKNKANAFGKFDTVAVVIEDLKGGQYHFEADEAIPMTWGQQRDLAMWMLDKPQPILEAFGYSDPLNVVELMQLLGMQSMRVPHVDERDKCVDVISRLLSGDPGPDGKPMGGKPVPGPDGNPQASIQPGWSDDVAFHVKLVKAYLTQNFELEEENPQGYQNVVLYGQACEKMAQQPPAPPQEKATVSLALKGSDLGDPATQAALQKAGIIPPGTQVQALPDPKLMQAQHMPPPPTPV